MEGGDWRGLGLEWNNRFWLKDLEWYMVAILKSSWGLGIGGHVGF